MPRTGELFVLTTVTTKLIALLLAATVVVIFAVCNLLSIIVFADVALVTACTVILGKQCQTLYS
jgi:hypothetical protein